MQHEYIDKKENKNNDCLNICVNYFLLKGISSITVKVAVSGNQCQKIHPLLLDKEQTKVLSIFLCLFFFCRNQERIKNFSQTNPALVHL